MLYKQINFAETMKTYHWDKYKFLVYDKINNNNNNKSIYNTKNCIVNISMNLPLINQIL